MSASVPVTERPNSVTQDIDLATPKGIVGLLNQCDSQIFTGWDTCKTIYSDDVAMVISRLSQISYEILQAPGEGLVVLSGCGTSGRLAFITSRYFNKMCSKDNVEPSVYEYIIAGGDSALLKSQEAYEDSFQTGVDSLAQCTKGKRRVLFIGITCGFSASFVAGQLYHCLQHSDVFVPVLLGFNPTSLAQKISIRGTELTFSDVAKQLEDAVREGKGFILNPIVGPEAVTGSTRMKSGSATKLLLEVIFSCGHHLLREKRKEEKSLISKEIIWRCLQTYETVYRQTYLHGNVMEILIKAAHVSLSTGGHVYYISGGSLGIVALIDASECPPTYGAAFTDIKAFLYNGYTSLGNKDGVINSKDADDCYFIGWRDFKERNIPKLQPNDLVIFIFTETSKEEMYEEMMLLSQQVREKGSKTVLLLPGNSKTMNLKLTVDIEVVLQLDWEVVERLWPFDVADQRILLTELALKWLLNAVTTGAHIMKGKVLGNKMVDLQVSNTKLYHRSIRIIQDCTGVGRPAAERCLLSSIYSTDQPSDALFSCEVAQHLKMATGQEKIVPVAILLANGRFSLDEARTAIQQEPVLRKAFNVTCMHTSSSHHIKQ